ncbi:hypothetical protein V6N13_024973 [Hibiscus sabdariffa]
MECAQKPEDILAKEECSIRKQDLEFNALTFLKSWSVLRSQFQKTLLIFGVKGDSGMADFEDDEEQGTDRTEGDAKVETS